jgi:hypothetical protein
VCDPNILQNIFKSINQGTRFEADVLMNTPQAEIWYYLFADNSQHQEGSATILLHHYDIHQRKTTERALRQQAWMTLLPAYFIAAS